MTAEEIEVLKQNLKQEFIALVYTISFAQFDVASTDIVLTKLETYCKSWDEDFVGVIRYAGEIIAKLQTALVVRTNFLPKPIAPEEMYDGEPIINEHIAAMLLHGYRNLLFPVIIAMAYFLHEDNNQNADELMFVNWLRNVRCYRHVDLKKIRSSILVLTDGRITPSEAIACGPYFNSAAEKFKDQHEQKSASELARSAMGWHIRYVEELRDLRTKFEGDCDELYGNLFFGEAISYSLIPRYQKNLSLVKDYALLQAIPGITDEKVIKQITESINRINRYLSDIQGQVFINPIGWIIGDPISNMYSTITELKSHLPKQNYVVSLLKNLLAVIDMLSLKISGTINKRSLAEVYTRHNFPLPMPATALPAVHENTVESAQTTDIYKKPRLQI